APGPGAPKFESVKPPVTVPTSAASAFDYRLETAWGTAPPFQLLLSDLPEFAHKSEPGPQATACPIAITSVLDQPDAEHCHVFSWKKGEVWSLAVQARRIDSPLDVSLAVLGPDGKELARNDDLPGTTDAARDFTVPANGTYRVLVSDMAGRRGTRSGEGRGGE